MPTAIRLTRAVAVVLVAVVLTVPARAGTALAHAQLLGTNPADRAVIAAPLTAVTLTFSEQMKQQFSTVVVRGADGRTYSDGAARSVDHTLTQSVLPLPGGQITVAWRVVSQDGHPLQGQFTFTNAAASDVPAASPATPAGQASSATAAPRAGTSLLWYVGAPVLVLLVAAVAAVSVVRRRS